MRWDIGALTVATRRADWEDSSLDTDGYATFDGRRARSEAGCSDVEGRRSDVGDRGIQKEPRRCERECKCASEQRVFRVTIENALLSIPNAYLEGRRTVRLDVTLTFPPPLLLLYRASWPPTPSPPPQRD